MYVPDAPTVEQSDVHMIAKKSAAAVGLLAALSSGTTASDEWAGRTYALSLTSGSRLMLEAKINHHSADALLDSAAEATILDRKFARVLNLTGGQRQEGHGSGQASFDTTLVNGVTLEALGLSLENQSVAVADLEDVGRRLLNRPISVILGREIFDAARLRIDIDRRQIAVVSRDQAPHGVQLALTTEHGVETVPVRVEDGAPVRATFDLGNGSHILISRSFAMRLGVLTDGRAVSAERGGGLGGETTRQVVTLRSIEIAGRKFDRVQAAIDPQASASDSISGFLSFGIFASQPTSPTTWCGSIHAIERKGLLGIVHQLELHNPIAMPGGR